jgi:hypothetical protein
MRFAPACVPLAIVAALSTWSRPADACGGTFCDSGPAAMQVDQTGEVILFAFGDGFVEAHVQIEYDGGDASKFAWIVPVLAVPEVEVGSFRLIQNALDATVPVYGLSQTGSCDDDGGASSAGFLQSPDGGSAGTGGPEVVVHDTVGVFEYVVLQGGTAETIGEWLSDNGYSPDDEAPEILDAYIDEGHVFVAFKLLHSVGVEDLHPVVLRYAGDEPCIPLRLTRVAAIEDMPIRALVLSDERVFPLSWRHVLLNRVRLDWIGLGANYDELVSLAIDAEGAEGRAFVTEYAGTTNVIDTSTLDTAGYDPSAFMLAPVTDVVEILGDMGLAQCDENGCFWGHELVPSLLHEFVPVPAAVEENDFYACLSCYADDIDADAWSGPGFAAAFGERIVAPMDHGRALLETWPYVTRLYTRVSPHEMITDPTFVRIEGQGDVANRLGAQRTDDCCGTSVRLPGGREVKIGDGGNWPSFADEMPWAERVEAVLPSGGPPAELVNATAEIDAILDAHNAAMPCDEGGGGSGGDLDDGPTDPDDGPDDDGPGSASGVDDTTSSGGDGPGADGPSGCACTSGARSSALAFLGLALLGLRTRRRR